VPAVLGAVTDEDVKKVLDNVQYKADAEKVAGMSVDHVYVDLPKIQDVDEADITAIKKIVGKDGLLVRLAALGDDHVAMLFGGGSKRVEQVAELLKKGEMPLVEDDGLKAIAPHLPKGKRFFEMYIAGDTAMKMINEVAVAAGEDKPITVEIPEIKAPLAVVGTVEKDAQRVTIFAPMKLIKGVKDVVMGVMTDKMVPTEEAPETKTTEEKPADEKPAKAEEKAEK
jgi:hypothetical protein